jgi:DNA primase
LGRIPQETLDQIAAANDIVAVVESYFPLKRAGTTFKALCPFHQERSPSFTVNPQRQIFKCFGCGAGGGVFRFVMDYEHVEFGVAVRRLAERAGIRIVEEELSAEDEARVTMRSRLLTLHAAAADWFHLQLMRTKGALVARDYLKGRGIGAEVARGWKLGYAPEAWDAFGGWARGERYSQEEINASGLVSQRENEDGSPGRVYDRFRSRVMFPICNDFGEVIAFSGRTLEANPKAAKYVNSPETILFTKGAVLFGFHRTKRAIIEKKSAIVCEGQLDLITAYEAGVQNTIAPQGTAFTAQQARTLRRYAEEVVLCFDADAAGEKAAERSLVSLLAEGMAVRVIGMPPGEDPDSLIRSQGVEAFAERVRSARDFFDFQLDRLSATPDFATPRGHASVTRKLAAWVNLIHDDILKQAVANRLVTRLETSREEFGRLLVAPRRSPSGEGSEPPPERITPALTDPCLRLLASVALRDAAGRNWILEAPWRDLFAAEPEGTLVAKILEAPLEVEGEQIGGLSSFLAELEPAEEAEISSLLGQPAELHPVTAASNAWNSLVRRQNLKQIESCRARLKDPQLSAVDMVGLMDEMKRLQTHNEAIGLPVPPPF